MKLLKRIALLVVGLLASCLSANAVLIYSADFNSVADGNPDGYLFGFSYTGSGTVSAEASIQSGTGVGGSKAAVMSMDFSGASGAPYWGAGMGRTVFEILAPPTSVNLSDYTFSASYRTTGATGNSIRFIAKFEGVTDAEDLEIRSPALAASEGFTTYSSSLDSWTFDDGRSLNDILAATGFTWIVETQNFTNWGTDTGNLIVIDDVSFSVVPEPSTYAALAGVALLGLVCLRRRR